MGNCNHSSQKASESNSTCNHSSQKANESNSTASVFKNKTIDINVIPKNTPSLFILPENLHAHDPQNNTISLKNFDYALFCQCYCEELLTKHVSHLGPSTWQPIPPDMTIVSKLLGPNYLCHYLSHLVPYVIIFDIPTQSKHVKLPKCAKPGHSTYSR